ncbi:MAG: 50S ribosomal protein L15 [Legionellales bacterium]|nr:50S ribosomal protein L15 [Legionellales bacterium]|tara:strand:+ start:348 stop:797 length:450 start_codon:yes stop_codon:yes gene_type:complete
MRLNEMAPAVGSKKAAKRVGRGCGSGLGKTCGRGVKGQKSRSGGYHKVGFEGGQMPLQRRLPKFGFTAHKSHTREEVRLGELNKMASDVVTLESLKEAGLIRKSTKDVKVMLKGELTKALTLKGIKISKAAKAAVEAAGGKVEEAAASA